MEERTQPTFAIGIPARDEALLVEDSITSVLASADALARPDAARLVIACDSCTDDTARLARSLARRDGRIDVIEGAWQSAGACRAAAIGQALENAGPERPLSETWVATTDADTVVPVDWLPSQATSWLQGDHAVAGVVDLLEGLGAVGTLFRRHYTLGHDSHGHVHGANLGIRADAYVAVGGFPALVVAEDHALWRALRQAGFTCRPSVSLRVVTSARLTGRAVGGFADNLRQMMSDAVIDPTTVTA